MTNTITNTKEFLHTLDSLFNQALLLSEKIDNESIDRDIDAEGEALNFIDYQARFEVFTHSVNEWKSGEAVTISDIDLPGLAGLDDDFDEALEALDLEESDKLDSDFFEDYRDDFEDFFERAITGMQYCIDNHE